MTIVGTGPVTPLGIAPLKAMPAGDSAPAGPVPAPPLYHFTCDHCAPSIIATGALIPNRHPFMPQLAPAVWLTVDANPRRTDVGLTSDSLSCDRMAHRFRVLDPSVCLPWVAVMDAAPEGALPYDFTEMLERGCRPGTWWVSFTNTPVVLF